ncbi:hypothetical protein CMI47_01105 [Candidatus Pacearchaeota archaeon]|nr:hypothetical protein [Candidatus Pacearchaeota archaeon]
MHRHAAPGDLYGLGWNGFCGLKVSAWVGRVAIPTEELAGSVRTGVSQELVEGNGLTAPLARRLFVHGGSGLSLLWEQVRVALHSRLGAVHAHAMEDGLGGVEDLVDERQLESRVVPSLVDANDRAQAKAVGNGVELVTAERTDAVLGRFVGRVLRTDGRGTEIAHPLGPFRGVLEGPGSIAGGEPVGPIDMGLWSSSSRSRREGLHGFLYEDRGFVGGIKGVAARGGIAQALGDPP